MSVNLTSMSKFLAKVLRHDPDMIGIKLDENGWTDVDELIRCAGIYQNKQSYDKLTHEILEEIIEKDDKGRYEFSVDGWEIRAVQGHSVKVDLQLNAIEPPEILYHGTATRFAASIMNTGLDKRSRHAVHLSSTADQARKVGSRHGNPVVLLISAKDMHNDGFEFFQSKNGVWLVDNIPARYIDRQTKQDDTEA